MNKQQQPKQKNNEEKNLSLSKSTRLINSQTNSLKDRNVANKINQRSKGDKH